MINSITSFEGSLDNYYYKDSNSGSKDEDKGILHDYNMGTLEKDNAFEDAYKEDKFLQMFELEEVIVEVVN